MIHSLAEDKLSFVTAFQGKVLGLARDAYGCRVLQRCLERLPLSCTRPLIDEVLRYARELMVDQFGVRQIIYVVEILLLTALIYVFRIM